MFKTLFLKKLKEFLLFAVCLIVPLTLFIITSFFSVDLLSDSISFVGVSNYIRMFANDQIFIKALFNTLATPTVISFLPVSILAVIIFLLRQKIKTPRLIFYISSVLIGGLAAMIYIIYINIAFLGLPGNSYVAQTIVSHIGDYSPSIFDIITLPNIITSLYIGIFTAFVFWFLELIVDIIKFSKRNSIKLQ